jgi:hypothetical protein
MRLSFTKDPVRLILGIALVALGLVLVFGVGNVFGSAVLSALGVVLGGMMLLKKR